MFLELGTIYSRDRADSAEAAKEPMMKEVTEEEAKREPSQEPKEQKDKL